MRVDICGAGAQTPAQLRHCLGRIQGQSAGHWERGPTQRPRGRSFILEAAPRFPFRATAPTHGAAHTSIPPEILEPVRRQGRVDRRAGDGTMAEPTLDRSRVMALVGEGVAAGVTEHMWVGLES